MTSTVVIPAAPNTPASASCGQVSAHAFEEARGGMRLIAFTVFASCLTTAIAAIAGLRWLLG